MHQRAGADYSIPHSVAVPGDGDRDEGNWVLHPLPVPVVFRTLGLPLGRTELDGSWR